MRKEELSGTLRPFKDFLCDTRLIDCRNISCRERLKEGGCALKKIMLDENGKCELYISK